MARKLVKMSIDRCNECPYFAGIKYKKSSCRLSGDVLYPLMPDVLQFPIPDNCKLENLYTDDTVSLARSCA